MKLISSEEQVVNIEEFLAMKADAVIHDLGKLHEPAMVKAVGALQANVVDVARKVIELVSVNA